MFTYWLSSLLVSQISHVSFLWSHLNVGRLCWTTWQLHFISQNQRTVISCRSITFSVFVCFCLSLTQWMKRVTSCPAGWFPPRGDVYLSKVSQFVARSTKSPLVFYGFNETKLLFGLLSVSAPSRLCLQSWICGSDWSLWDCRRVLQLRRQKVDWWRIRNLSDVSSLRVLDLTVWWWRVGCRWSIVAPFNI